MFLRSSTVARDVGEEWGERFTTLALHARFPAVVLVRTGDLGLGLYLAGLVVGCRGSVVVETTVSCPNTFHLVDVAAGSGTRST